MNEKLEGSGVGTLNLTPSLKIVIKLQESGKKLNYQFVYGDSYEVIQETDIIYTPIDGDLIPTFMINDNLYYLSDFIKH